jgi:hypothetical protein
MRNSMQREAEITSNGNTAMNPDHSEIAALAYELWKDRGCPIGSPEEDWFQAEAELKTGNEATAAAA